MGGEEQYFFRNENVDLSTIMALIAHGLEYHDIASNTGSRALRYLYPPKQHQPFPPASSEKFYRIKVRMSILPPFWWTVQGRNLLIDQEWLGCSMRTGWTQERCKVEPPMATWNQRFRPKLGQFLLVLNGQYIVISSLS